MGVYQHHDAIAGTAKQAVADDYALRLTRGLKQSADSLSDLLLNNTLKGFELEKDGLFEICDRVNGTFVDCPINNYDLSKSTYVVIQNPSSIPMKMAQISLPSGKFSAQKYIQKSQKWNTLTADIMCNKVDLYNSNATEACQMFIQVDILPKQLILVKLDQTSEDH